MTPSAHTLAFRLLLASVSIAAYAVLVQMTMVFETVEQVPNMNTMFHVVVGAVFGAFVLTPYARAPLRVLRGIALAIAAAAIYYGAVRFVANAPVGLDVLATFVLAGTGAALLCGLAVAVIAPQPFGLRLAALLVVAGAAGGAAFDVKVSYDPNLLLAHAAWQLLACLALHFGQRNPPT